MSKFNYLFLLPLLVSLSYAILGMENDQIKENSVKLKRKSKHLFEESETRRHSAELGQNEFEKLIAKEEKRLSKEIENKRNSLKVGSCKSDESSSSKEKKKKKKKSKSRKKHAELEAEINKHKMAALVLQEVSRRLSEGFEPEEIVDIYSNDTDQDPNRDQDDSAALPVPTVQASSNTPATNKGTFASVWKSTKFAGTVLLSVTAVGIMAYGVVTGDAELVQGAGHLIPDSSSEKKEEDLKK